MVVSMTLGINCFMTSSHVGLDGGDSVVGFIGENTVISSSLFELLVVEHKSIISGCACI